MDYRDESGILKTSDEPKILAAVEEETELYRIHRSPLYGGTWFLTSKEKT